MQFKIFDLSRTECRWIWATLALWLVVIEGPPFADRFRVADWQARATLPDFFQEWSSARNVSEGLPPYTNLAIPVERYLGRPVDLSRSLVIINAHPPTSILLAWPLCRLRPLGGRGRRCDVRSRPAPRYAARRRPGLRDDDHGDDLRGSLET